MSISSSRCLTTSSSLFTSDLNSSPDSPAATPLTTPPPWSTISRNILIAALILSIDAPSSSVGSSFAVGNLQ